MNYAERIEAVRRQRVNQVIAMRQKGLTLAEIGKKFGVSRQRIHQIIAAARQVRLD